MTRAAPPKLLLLFFFLAAATTLAGCAVERDDANEPLGESAQALATTATVYTNAALTSPWQNWSWSSTVAFNNTTAPLRSSSTSQIRFTTTSSWGALSLARSTGNLPVADYESISFDVRGNASSSLYLSLETLSGTGGTKVTVPVTTTWSKKTISVRSLEGSLTSFGKITLMAANANQTFYVDNVKVIAKTTTSSTTSTAPTAPITVRYNDVVTLSSPSAPYYLYVPSSYPANHSAPTKLLVWMHGCGGDGYGDAWTVSPGGTQSWLSVSLGGRDGQCWNVDTDTALVLAALDDVKRRVHVDPKRVVIGGYSSGGDLAYRTAFYNAGRFAGVIAENTSPFRDTGSTQSASIAAASWKLNVAHLAHLSDANYLIAAVRTETDALIAAGFPMTRIERAGTHWDADTATSGTDYDLRTFLLPYLDRGWTAP